MRYRLYSPERKPGEFYFMASKEATLNPTHSFELADVEKYGSIEKALLIKELRSMQVYKQRNDKTGWVYYSGKALEEKFPYMAARSIRRWLNELVESGHLETSIRNKKKYDQTKSYRLKELSTSGQNVQSIGQNGQSKIGQNGQPIPPHSTPHSTPHSKDWDFEKRRAYRKACDADRALARREVRRAAPSNKGSFGSIGDVLGATFDVPASV
jgi:hypothetical protein